MSERPAPDRWDGDRFRSIDASLGTLFRQMVRAMSALLIASFVAFGALDHMVLRAGLTFAELLLGAAVISAACGLTLRASTSTAAPPSW